MKSRTRRMLERRRRKRRVKLKLYGNYRGDAIISPITVSRYMKGAWDALREANPFFRQLGHDLLMATIE